MSGEVEIVGKKSALSIALRLSYAETSPAFLLLMLMTQQITRSVTLIPLLSTRLPLRLRTKY